MTSQAERIREQALRAREKTQTNAGAPQEPPQQERSPEQPVVRRTPAPEVKAAPRGSGGAHTPRLRPVRKNVDLSPDLNRRLGDWQRDTAIELGLARVTAQEVLTELIRELLEDPTLGERIKDRIRSSVDQ